MAHRADMDDPVFKALDAVLAGLTIELSSEIAQGNASPVTPMLLPQIFEARSARLARLNMARSSISEAQWFALVALMVSVQVSVALIYNYHPPPDPGGQCGLAGSRGGLLRLARARSAVHWRHYGQSQAAAAIGGGSQSERCDSVGRRRQRGARRSVPIIDRGMTPTRSVGWHVIHLINR
jgi:hypothetical protein